jgi:hypothetical protein
MGSPVPQNANGDLLGHVRDLGIRAPGLTYVPTRLASARTFTPTGRTSLAFSVSSPPSRAGSSPASCRWARSSRTSSIAWQRLDREEAAPPPIVVVSAADDVRKRAGDVGAAGWLAKPFDLEDLTRAVEARSAAPLHGG